jgi:hypothetical protein
MTTSFSTRITRLDKVEEALYCCMEDDEPEDEELKQYSSTAQRTSDPSNYIKASTPNRCAHSLIKATTLAQSSMVGIQLFKESKSIKQIVSMTSFHGKL